MIGHVNWRSGTNSFWFAFQTSSVFLCQVITWIHQMTCRNGSVSFWYLFPPRLVIFFIWVIFHVHSRFTGQQGKGEVIYLTPLYHFHPLHRHLKPVSNMLTFPLQYNFLSLSMRITSWIVIKKSAYAEKIVRKKVELQATFFVRLMRSLTNL